LGDYLVSKPVIPEVLRTNFMLTRSYGDQRHLRTDYGAWRPPFAVLPEGLFFFGGHSFDQTDLALVDPAHHRLIWSAPWPFAEAPQNYIVRGHKDLLTWADASHWVAYALDDGRIVGTGRKQRRDAVVAAHGVSATLEVGARGHRALALRPLQVLQTDARLATREPYRGGREWFSPAHELTYLVSHDGGLDPEHGLREHRDIDAFILNFRSTAGQWRVKWRMRADGRAPRGAFRIRQRASAGSAPLFTDLRRLPIQPPLEGHSVLMLPQEVFQRARAKGRVKWKDLHGGSDTLEYLGETWHQAAFDDQYSRLEIMPAHLFRSGNAEYRVVMSGDVPVVVYAHYGDWVVYLAEVKGRSAK